MYTNSRGGGKPQSAGENVPLYVAGRGKPVAFVSRGVLRKGIRPEHFLRKPPGAIAFDESIMVEAVRHGAHAIEVTDLERGTVYTCSMADFRRWCFTVDRGFGRQWALERGRWSIDGATPLLQAREEAQAAKDSQLSLFGVSA